MTIAVTYENGLVFQHFGHTEQFKIYETDGASILSQRILSSDGQGHGALAVLLSGNKVDALMRGSGCMQGCRAAVMKLSESFLTELWSTARAQTAAIIMKRAMSAITILRAEAVTAIIK